MAEEKKSMLKEGDGKPSFSRVVAFIIIFINLIAGAVIVGAYAKGNPGTPMQIPDIPTGWAGLAAALYGVNKLSGAIKK